MLNTHPLALKHLMPALMHFYIEVEQTGASSQFYDKFNARFVHYLFISMTTLTALQTKHRLCPQSCMEQPNAPRSTQGRDQECR